MICEKCKEREAKVHVTRINAGKQTSVHLCQVCAQETGISATPAVSLPTLLSNLISQEGGQETEDTSEYVTCSTCGMSYYTFKQSGRFGCGQCYRTFEANVGPLLEKVQRHDRHVGKAPKRTGIRLTDQIDEVRRRLRTAVESEDFEVAARLRDEIRNLEGRDKSRQGPEDF